MIYLQRDDGEAKFRRPDQGSHGCPRDSFISSGYSVSFFVLSFRVPASRDFAYVSFPSSSIPDESSDRTHQPRV